MITEELESTDAASPPKNTPPAPSQPPAEKPTTAVPSSRRKYLLVFGAIILVVAAVAGQRLLAFWSQYQSTDDAFIDGHIIPTSARVAGHVAKVHVEDNQLVKSGDLLVEIDPRDYETKLAQAKAALQVLEAKKKAAEDTAAMTRTTSAAAVAQAQANVALARAAVQTAAADIEAAKGRQARADAEIVSAKAKIEQAQAQATATDAYVTRTQQDVDRYKLAVEASAGSRQQYEYAIAAHDAAVAVLDAAQKSVASAQANLNSELAAKSSVAAEAEQSASRKVEAEARVNDALGKLASALSAPQQIAVADSEVVAMAAQVEQARAALRQAELDLSYTKVFATEDGRVTRKSVENGAYIQAGETLLALVPQNVWITANFKETQLTDMKAGNAVDVTIDAYPGKSFKAHVESIQSGTGARFALLPPENATGNFVKVVQRVPVKITFDVPASADVLLAPGMSVVPEVKVK